MTTLAQALAARGLGPADIAAAELHTKASGGGLESALLELGLLKEAQAIDLVVELSRLPRPPVDLVAQLSPAAAPLFPQPLAERHGMVPLGLLRRQLQLMVRHPVDLGQIDEIGFLLSRPIKLYVGTEIEIAEAMREVYGLAIPVRFADLRKKLGPPVATAASVATAAPLLLKTPEPLPSAPTRPPFELARPSTSATSVPATPLSPVAPQVSALSPEPAAAPESLAPEKRPTLRLELGAEGAPASLEGAAAPRVEPAAAQPAVIAPANASAPVAPEKLSPATSPVTEAAPEAAQAPAIAPSPRDSEPGSDRSSTVFWEEAGDLLSLKPRTPVLPQPAVPLAVQDLPAEPSPFESGPFEAAPVEVQASSPGPQGRIGLDRRISTAEALASLRAQTSRDGVIGIAINFLRGAFDFVAIFTRRGDSFQVFEASGIDYGGGADLSQTVVDLERSRVLRTVVEGRAPYVGQVPAGDPLETALGAVGRARLRAVLLYPVVIRDRTVAVVHGDRGGEALAPRQLSDVALVLAQLGAQLERVLRERRRGASDAARGVRDVAARAVPPAADPKPESPELATAASPAAHEVAAPLAVSPAARPETDATPVSPPVASDDRSSNAPSKTAAPPSIQPAVAQPPEAGSAGKPSDQEDELALNAAALADGEPFEVPIDWVDVEEGSGFSDQVRAFLSGDPPARAKAAEILRKGGADAAWALAERFPGPLFVFRMAIDELPGPDGIGPVLGLMAAIGVDSIPALLQLADASGEERRFWATVLLAKFGDKRAIEVLSRRLLDSSPDVALAARRGLYRLRKEPEFVPVLDQVTAELNSTSNPERLTAIVRALGHFHHVPAVPRLISLVGIRDPQISGAASDALRELTRQDFGNAERRWSTWWSAAKARPRLQWLIEALESRDRDLRLAAISELSEVAGLDFGYRSDIEPRKQEGPLGRWHEWWEREGRHRADAALPDLKRA